MKSLRAALLLLSVLVAARAAAGPEEDVAAATQAWVEAFNSREPARVTALYAADAVFWGTTSPTLRDTPEEVRDYFRRLPERPLGRVRIDEQHIRVFGDAAMNVGAYTFSNVVDGRMELSPARFTFVFVRREGRWVIVHHHSSAQPPPRQ